MGFRSLYGEKATPFDFTIKEIYFNFPSIIPIIPSFERGNPPKGSVANSMKVYVNSACGTGNGLAFKN